MMRRIPVLPALLAGMLTIGGCNDGQAELFTPQRPGTDEGGHTILLKVVTGDGHIEAAKKVKALTEKETQWNGIFVVHKRGMSQICWGMYDSVTAAQNNLKRAKTYRTVREGAGIFARAMVIPVPGKSVGPPEWDLTRAVGEHTVLVAAFYDVPEKKYVGRKRFAVQYCRRLREHGYEAYYYHGLRNSTVTVGAFPSSSFRADESGRKQIADPRITGIMKEFPHLAVNGNAVVRQVYNRQTRKYEAVKRKTYLVRIPRRKAGDDGGPFDPAGNSQPG